MGADVAAVSIVSVFWVVVGAIVPWFIRKGSHRSLIQAMIVTTSICCYLFWLCTYMSQMYPLREDEQCGGKQDQHARTPYASALCTCKDH
ncbi:hypothetical protein MTO96_010276 [Rhipicephalus appendiculatus]